MARQRKPRCYEPHVAMVEGVDHGVYWRTFFKRMAAAERFAKKWHGSTITDLCTLEQRRWISNAWRQV